MLGMTFGPNANAMSTRHRNGTMDGWPVWARVTAWLGIPTLFAGVLLYFVLGQVAQGMNEHQSLLQHHVQDTQNLERLLKNHLESEDAKARMTLTVMRNLCLQLAKTTPQISACWDGQ